MHNEVNQSIDTTLDSINSALLECQGKLDILLYSLYNQGFRQEGDSLETLWQRLDVDLSIIQEMRKERS